LPSPRDQPGNSAKVPKLIAISERRIGWRIGTLVDALDARERAAAGA
jgi:hypothetical protein